MRIALLEDDPDQAELIRLWLEDAEYAVIPFERGSDFLRAIRRDSFDLYMLDWMLPDVSGIDVLVELRQNLRDTTPVMLATVKQEERDIVRALESGADDYLVKPVRRREMIARVEAIWRRYGHGLDDADGLEATPYALDLRRKEASVNGEVISLTNREFELALFFFRHAGQALSRAHILDAIWDIDNDDVSTRTVDTHISRLRKKMKLNEENGWQLSAIYQHGYRLEQVGSRQVQANL